jgi:hypothetical protein
MWPLMVIVFVGRVSDKLQYRSKTVGAVETVLLDRNPGPVNHWSRAPCHAGFLFQAVSEEDPKNCQTPATQVIDCSLCYCTASSTDTPVVEKAPNCHT